MPDLGESRAPRTIRSKQTGFAVGAPAATAISLTLEAETSHSPVAPWPAVFEERRFKIRAPVMLVHGRLFRRQGGTNVAADRALGVKLAHTLPPSRN